MEKHGLFKVFKTYSGQSAWQRSKPSRPRCWYRQSTPPCPPFSPPGSPHCGSLCLLAAGSFQRTSEGGHPWTSTPAVWESLGDNRVYASKLRWGQRSARHFAIYADQRNHLAASDKRTLNFKLHLCKGWTWTDMNIMKIVHNLRQLVVFSHWFKSLCFPVQKQCKQERVYIDGNKNHLFTIEIRF